MHLTNYVKYINFADISNFNPATDQIIDVAFRRDMSLLSVLHDYNKANYQLNPVIVTQEDYNTYYGGMSNGLLWPAFHNLGEYILKDYDNDVVRLLNASILYNS